MMRYDLLIKNVKTISSEKKKCSFHSAGCRVASHSVPSMILQVTMALSWHREIPAKGH